MARHYLNLTQYWPGPRYIDYFALKLRDICLWRQLCGRRCGYVDTSGVLIGDRRLISIRCKGPATVTQFYLTSTGKGYTARGGWDLVIQQPDTQWFEFRRDQHFFFIFSFFSFSFSLPISKKCISMQNLFKIYGAVQELWACFEICRENDKD